MMTQTIDEMREKALDVRPRARWAVWAARDYLDRNHDRGWGNYLTPGTWCAYSLRGRAKDYMGDYVRSLIRQLDELEAAGLVKMAPSKCNGRAYIWAAEGDES